MQRLLYFTSMLSQEEFEGEMKRAERELALPFTYRLNRVHRGEDYLNFGFLYLDNPALFHAFLGNNLDGTPRVERKEVNSPKKVDPEASVDWADFEEEEIPLPPLIEFPEIRFSPAQAPEVGENFSRETICSRDFPAKLSLKKVEKEASFYSTFPDYPKSKEKLIDRRRVVFLTYHPQSNDAQYALLMLKQTKIEGYLVRFTQSYKNSKKVSTRENRERVF